MVVITRAMARAERVRRMGVITRAMARAERVRSPAPKRVSKEKTGSITCSDPSIGNPDGWEIYSWKKRTRKNEKDDPLTEAIEVLTSIIKLNTIEKRKFFIEKRGKTCCSRCGAKGEWVRGRKNPKTGAWLWGCGILTGKTGCGRVISQNILFGEALGIEDHKELRDRMPLGAFRQVGNLDVSPVTNIKEADLISPKITGGEHMDVPNEVVETPLVVNGDQPPVTGEGSLLAAGIEMIASAIKIVKLSTTLDQAKTANSILEQAEMFLKKVGTLEVRKEPMTAVTTVQKPLRPSQPQPPKPLSYSDITGKGGMPNTRKVVPRCRIETKIEQVTTDPNQRRKLACEALGWKTKAPIGQRMLRGTAQLREGPLKDNVDALEFVYVEGMTKMRYGEARGIMRVGGIDTRNIRDISYVGKSVCSLLVSKSYKNELVSILVSVGSPLKIIPDFDPLSGEHFKRPAAAGHTQSPVDSYIRRAALAVVNNRKLEVATKYQAQLPMEHKDRLRMEVQRLIALRNGSKDTSKIPSKTPAGIKTQEGMDIDS